MKKITTLLIISSFLFACSGTQKTANAISSGNYNAAFNNAIEKLNKDKNKFAKQVPLLKDAYDKAYARDIAKINQLKKNKTEQNLKSIYKTYMKMDARQGEVILLEPLRYDGKEYNFDANDYDNDIKNAKNAYSDILYRKAEPMLYGNKENARKAYELLDEIQVLNPDYRSDLNNLILATQKRGMDYVLVQVKNKVGHILNDSTSLAELKHFGSISTGNFTNKWVKIHDKRDYNVQYGYQLNIELDKYVMIPEKTNSQKVNQEKQIQTGWNYTYDEKGNVKKDADGNDIKTPKMENVKAVVTLFQQIKSSKLDGKVTLKKLTTNQVINATPIESEAKLENVYGTYIGNPKAIDQKYVKALQTKKATFPKDAAFNKFAIQQFKAKVENYMLQQKF